MYTFGHILALRKRRVENTKYTQYGLVILMNIASMLKKVLYKFYNMVMYVFDVAITAASLMIISDFKL